MFGHSFFGARFYGNRYFGDGGNAAPPVVAETFSGGFSEVSYVKRRRTVEEDRERLGIIPASAKKVIEKVAAQSVAQEKTEAQALGLLQQALALKDIQPAPQYEKYLELERDRRLSRDIAMALRIKAKQRADEEDEREAEMLLM